MYCNFKENFLRLVKKKFGGPYALIPLGIERGIITGILRGSIPKADNAYKIAALLNVTVDDLVYGEEKPIIIESPSIYEIQTNKEREYTTKLLEIFRTKDKETQKAIIQNIDQFLRVPSIQKKEDAETLLLIPKKKSL